MGAKIGSIFLRYLLLKLKIILPRFYVRTSLDCNQLVRALSYIDEVENSPEDLVPGKPALV